MNVPPRERTVGGDECDAFSKRARRVSYPKGGCKNIKRKYNRRIRRLNKQNIRNEVEG